MSGARQMDLGHIGLDRPGIHALFPVLVVAVVHAQADRAAERAAMAHTGRNLGAVLFDLHAPAAPVTELAPGKVAVDVLGAQLQARRKALDDRGQPGTVGLAGGYKAQGHGRLSLQTAPVPPGAARAAACQGRRLRTTATKAQRPCRQPCHARRNGPCGHCPGSTVPRRSTQDSAKCRAAVAPADGLVLHHRDRSDDALPVPDPGCRRCDARSARGSSRSDRAASCSAWRERRPPGSRRAGCCPPAEPGRSRSSRRGRCGGSAPSAPACTG